MKLEHIKEFLKLAEDLNYSTTAERLFISQSALSRHISTLEEDAGAQFLVRTTHNVELTELGKEAYKIFKDMMLKYDSFIELAGNYNKKVSGTVVLGLLYYSNDDYFSDFLPVFQKHYPLITIECRTYQPHEMYKDLLNGKIDIGQMSVGNYPGSDIIRFHKFLKSGMVAVMREDNPLAAKESVTLNEIKNETLIELKEDFCSRINVREMLAKCGIAFERSIETDHIETVPFAIKETRGVHLTGESCRKQGSRSLKYVPISDKNFQADMSFMFRVDNPNPLIQIFLKEADQFYQKAN